MRKKLTIVLALVVALSMLSLAPAIACDDRPLRGEMDLEFNLGNEDPTAPFPEISWIGTVEFDDETYGIVFVPQAGYEVQHFYFFVEEWSIYPYDESAPFFAFDEDRVLTVFDPPDPVLVGLDVGYTNLNNGRYKGWGAVDEAYEPFADLLAHRMFMKGKIEFYDDGAPHFAPGIFKIR